jgi:hypothetical protein
MLKAKAAKAAVEAERQRQEQSSALEKWNDVCIEYCNEDNSFR